MRHRRAERRERAHDAHVAGVFDADAIAGVQREPHDQVDRFLQARDDHNLLGRADDTSRRSEVIGQRALQRRIPGRRTSFQQRGRHAPQRAARHLRPQRGRKQIERGLIRAKRMRLRLDRWREGLGALRDVGQSPSARPTIAVVMPRAHARSRVQQRLRQHVADVRPRADAAREIAFGLQLIERRHDGAARKRVAMREIARRRQLHARTQPAVENRVAQRRIQLPIRRVRRPTRSEHEREIRRDMFHLGWTIEKWSSQITMNWTFLMARFDVIVRR